MKASALIEENTYMDTYNICNVVYKGTIKQKGADEQGNIVEKTKYQFFDNSNANASHLYAVPEVYVQNFIEETSEK